MAVEVTGGELAFEAEIDTRNFDVQINSMQKKIDQTFKAANESVNGFQNALVDAAKSTNKSFDPNDIKNYVDALKAAQSQAVALLEKGSATLDPQKFAEFQKEIAETNGEFKQLSETIDFIKQNIGSLNLNPEDSKVLAESIKTIENSFEGFTDKTVQATTRIRQLKNEMVSMADKSSPQFQALEDEAGRLQHEIDETNKSVKLLGSSSAGLQAGIGALRGVIGGFEAIAGAVGLASGKSEEMEHVISSVISAMGILNGIQEVSEVLSKRSALNQYLLLQLRKLTTTETIKQVGTTEALAGAQTAEIVTTEGATVAQLALNAVMKANPAFIVLTAISALAAGIYFLTQKSHEADQEATRLNKTLLDQYNLANQIYQLSKVNEDANIAAQEAGLEAARAQNASQKDILALQIQIDKAKQSQAEKDVQKAKDDLTGATSVAKLQEDAYRKIHKLSTETKPIDLGFTNTTDIPTLTKNLETLENKLIKLKNSKKADDKKDEIDHLQSQVDLLKPKIDAFIESLKNLSSTASKTTIDSVKEVTDAHVFEVKGFTAAQQAKTLALAQSQKEQLELTLNNIQAQAAAQLDPKLNPDLTEGEKSKIRAQSLKDQADAVFASNQKQSTDTVKFLQSQAALYKEGTQERLNLELAALAESKKAQEQTTIEINGKTVQYKKLTVDQLATIDNSYLEQVRELYRKHDKSVRDDQINTRISNDNAALSAAIDGTQKQLLLKKDLVDQQLALDISNAEFQINNQELLEARLKEIHAKAIADKQKLDDDYVKHYLDEQFKLIDQAANKNKQKNNDVLSDPTASAKDRLNAQLDNLDITANGIQGKIKEIDLVIISEIILGNGNIKDQIEKREALLALLNGVGKDKANLIISDKDRGLSKDAKELNEVGNAIGSVGNNLKQYNLDLGEILVSLGNIAKSVSTLFELSKSKGDDIGRLTAGLDSAVQLISLVVSAAAARAQAEKIFNAELLKQQEDYNLALNQNILLNTKLKDSVFVSDYSGQLKDSLDALKDAQSQYQKALTALSNGQAKDGQKTVPSGSAILAGAASGAVTGTLIGSIGGPIVAGIGTVIGAVAGAIVGLFGGSKKKDTYVALLQAYPDLLQKGANGAEQINVALAKSLLSNNQLDDATKLLVQDTLDWQDAIDKANEQLKSIITDLAGDLGGNIRDSLVEAFEDGTSAAQAFADSVQKTLENVLKNMLFNNVFGKAFADLQTKLSDSFQAGGDFNWQDDLESFFQQYGGLATEFNDALKEAQTEASKAGLSIFQTTADSAKGSNSLAGAIRGITEQQADLLAGQFGGLRITAIDQLKVAQNSYAALNEIVFNTAMLLDVKNTLNYFKLNGIKVL